MPQLALRPHSLRNALRAFSGRWLSTRLSTEKEPRKTAEVIQKVAKEAEHHGQSRSRKTAIEEKDKKAMEALMDRDGGLSGVELEDGEPVGLKRNIKNNMFRYI